MQHDTDYIYKGHEVVIMHDATGYVCDIRDDEFDGDLIAGFCEYRTEREARMKAESFIDGLIYDQTHFTAGISL